MAGELAPIVLVGLPGSNWQRTSREKPPFNKRRGAQREKPAPQEESREPQSEEEKQHLDLRA